jgi:hypothetical protein
MELKKVVHNMTSHDDVWCLLHMHQHAFQTSQFILNAPNGFLITTRLAFIEEFNQIFVNSNMVTNRVTLN